VTQDRLFLDEHEWRTATIWTDNLLTADHVTFCIVPAAAGDWFDIRQLAVPRRSGVSPTRASLLTPGVLD
jgi:hypothetical protein